MATKTAIQQRIIPMKAYEDGPAAMDWLTNAFGFTEKERWLDDEGRLTHGELELDGSVIMLAMPSKHYQGPKKHREACATAAAWYDVPWVIDGLLVYVDDIRAHFERARAAGATILSELETTDFGTRYRAEDLEGHRWMFVQAGP